MPFKSFRIFDTLKGVFTQGGPQQRNVRDVRSWRRPFPSSAVRASVVMMGTTVQEHDFDWLDFCHHGSVRAGHSA